MFTIQAYTWQLFFLHFCLAVVLFFIINWIGKRSLSVGYVQMDLIVQNETFPAFNFLFKVISPIVYIILLAVLFQSLHWDFINSKIYLVSVYYWGFRVLWILSSSRGRLVNWPEFLLLSFISIGLSVYINTLIDKVDTILPDPRALLDQMWILIIAFLYSIFNKLRLPREGTIRRKRNYIFSRFKLFKKRYNEQIHGYWNNPFYEAVTYSIMIYEDFNRSVLVRGMEYFRFFITKKQHTLGIMQVTTKKFINNTQSIALAMNKIKEDSFEILENIKEKPEDEWFYGLRCFVEKIAEKYNGGDFYYSEEIWNIFEQIHSQYYKESISPVVEKFGVYKDSGTYNPNL